MKIERFELERWMTRWELEVDYDICESGILPLSLAELYDLIGSDVAGDLQDTIATMALGYSEARGTIALRTILADTYRDTTPDDILVTTDGCRNLSAALPRDPDAVEAWMAALRQSG